MRKQGRDHACSNEDKIKINFISKKYFIFLHIKHKTQKNSVRKKMWLDFGAFKYSSNEYGADIIAILKFIYNLMAL